MITKTHVLVKMHSSNSFASLAPPDLVLWWAKTDAFDGAVSTTFFLEGVEDFHWTIIIPATFWF